MRNIVLSALAAASLVTFVTPAAAEPTRYVSYGDLDLSGPAGRTALRQRVTHAVEQVCGGIEARNIHSGEAVQACRTDTWSTVQPQLNAAFGASVRILADARIAIGRARSRS